MQTSNNAAAARRREQKMTAFGPDDVDCDGYPLYEGLDKNGKRRQFAAEKDPHRDWASPVVKFETGIQGNGCNDSDCLLMAEWDKHNELCRKHFGNESQWWDGRAPAKIEAFLRDYFDKPNLKLTQIQKMHNRSNGQPVWHFQYRI